jgi:hypothetical protein
LLLAVAKVVDAVEPDAVFWGFNEEHPAAHRAMAIIKVSVAITACREAFSFIFYSFSTTDYQYHST